MDKKIQKYKAKGQRISTNAYDSVQLIDIPIFLKIKIIKAKKFEKDLLIMIIELLRFINCTKILHESPYQV